ncbi:MAG TPA: lysylphosphatidylglycerol synthase domain-containing protein [Candidatus Saccharimonadales bacterium]|nr:lysylphosphatidylglycerol synthase domain-containing protein [Candidatus Saccharimonadales bacterium]
MLSGKRLRLVAAWTVIGATAYFFTKALVDNWHNLEGVDLGLDGWAIAGVLLFALAVVSSGMLWGNIVDSVSGRPIPGREAVRVQLLSWLLKYIPGQAGSYVSKIAWGVRHGYSKKLITITFIYENAFLAIASVALSLPIVVILLHDRVSESLSSFLPALLIIPLVLVLNQNVFYRVLNFVFGRLRGQSVDRDYFLSTGQLATYTLKYAVPRLITAAAFLCVVASMIGVPAGAYVGLSAIYILAGIIGLLAIFVPSGLGVREGIIVLLASHYFPVEIAIALSLAARLYATVADGVLALVYAVMTRRKGAA